MWPGTSTTLPALLYATNRLEEAEPLFRRVLGINEKAMGPEHLNVATCLENYASLLREMGRPEEAAPLEAHARAFGLRAP